MASGQVPIFPTTTAAIMASPEFRRGLDEVRNGVAFDWRVGGCDGGTNDAWNYERGRQFARIAPVSMPLRIGRRLNEGAIALYRAASKRRLII
jgi:hypothetical protein